MASGGYSANHVEVNLIEKKKKKKHQHYVNRIKMTRYFLAYVVDFLVSNSSIVLKNIVVLSTGCIDKFLHNWLRSAIRFEISKYRVMGTNKNLLKLIIRNLSKLRAVVLRDDQLATA
jgi:hypothetical protein